MCQTWKRIVYFSSIVELPHLVAVVCYELQQREGLARGLHLQVELPGQAGLAVHDEAPRQPGEIGVVSFEFLVGDVQEYLLGLLVIPHCSLGLAVVEVEGVVVVEVRLDGVEIQQHVVELLQ